MFELSHDSQRLVQLLAGINADVSYEAIATVLGKPVSQCRGALHSARKILEREKIVFATVKGIGLRRLTDAEKVHSTDKIKSSIRRASKRGLRRLDAIDHYTGLSSADQLTATIARTTFEAIKSSVASIQRPPYAPPPLPSVEAVVSKR